MALGAFFTNVLANLKFAQLADEQRAQHDAEQERGDAGEGGADGDVAEEAEAADGGIETIVEEIVKHYAAAPPVSDPVSARKASSARST